MHQAKPLKLEQAFSQLKFLAKRTPQTNESEARDAFSRIAEYRDGGVFIGHYAGNSQWERHAVGDELVWVIEGETTLYQLLDGEQVASSLGSGEMLVVPRSTWYRFETPNGVKILTVTPQPTDHTIDFPG